MKFHQGSLDSQMDSNQEETVIRLETKMDSLSSRMDVDQVKTKTIYGQMKHHQENMEAAIRSGQE